MNPKLLVAITLSVITAVSARGQELSFNVPKMAEVSDNIFIGTVNDIRCVANDKNIPTTVVHFQNIESSKTVTGDFEVVYAGGAVNNQVFEMSHTPRFKQGAKYVIFSADKSKSHFSPISGHKGLLTVIKDVATNDEYLLSDGHCVTSIKNGEIILGAGAIDYISNGVAVYHERSKDFEMGPAYTFDGKRAATMEPQEEKGTPITLADFKTLLAQEYNLSFAPVISSFGAQQHGPAAKTTGGISATTFQSTPITMFQLPTSLAPYYNLSAQCITNWNNVMNIFKTAPGNGTYNSHNNRDEFGGFPTSVDLQSKYGFGWGGSAVGVTALFFAGSGEIIESDVFANPAYTYTDDPWEQVKGKGFVYKSVITHELGHVWGLMDGGNESYDYNVATVMQGLSYGIYENGSGVHCADAVNFRGVYTQLGVPVINTVDVGVESYHAVDGTGLVSATSTKTSAKAGDTLTITGMTVENISNVAVNNLTVRFYLSKDTTYDSGDLAMGGANFPTAAPVSYATTTAYSLTMPTGAAGLYYICAVASYNNTTADNITGNNITFLPALVRLLPTTDIATTNSNTPNIQIAKMPTKGNYTLQMAASETGYIRLFNSMGQLIATQNLENKNISLPDADALYMLEVNTVNGKKVFKLLNY